MLQQTIFKPGQAIMDPGGWGSQNFYTIGTLKEARLSAVHTGRLYPPGDIPGTPISQKLSAAGRIKSMKNPNDSIGNWTRDPPACSAVPQQTAPPRTVRCYPTKLKLLYYLDGILRQEEGTYSICQVVTKRQFGSHHMRAIIKCYA